MSSGPTIELLAAGTTDQGRRRQHNEDAILIREELGFYVVCDGAGGHNAGNVASALATTEIAKQVEATAATMGRGPELDRFGLWSGAKRLVHAIQAANSELIDVARSANKYRGMGTTVVAALLSPHAGRLHVAHVGDSRLYRLRHGFLEQLTHDHSVLNDVIEMRPELDEGTLAKLPRKAITRALGMEESVRVSVRTHRVAPGDVYLLCSDGLTGEVTHEELQLLLSEPTTPEHMARALIDTANDAGGRDNISALVMVAYPGSGAARHRPTKSRAPDDPEIEIHGAEETDDDVGDLELDELEVAPPSDRFRDQRAPESEDSMGAAPDIVVVEQEVGEADPRISAVYSDEDSAAVLAQVDQYMETFAKKLERCESCEKSHEAGAAICPFCGATASVPSALT